MIQRATRRFSRSDYERMIARGIIRPDERVELVNGEIVVVTPQGARHATVLRLVCRAIERAVSSAFDVRSQLPLALGQSSEPEPDVALVRGSPDDFLREHPTMADLVIEVADSSLVYDRETKGELYARHRLPEYWIVNLIEGLVEVRRKPTLDAEGAWTWAELERVARSGTLTIPGTKATLKVADFLR